MSNNLYKDTCRKWYYFCMNNLGHYKSGKASDDFINIDKWDVFIGGKYINFLVCYYMYQYSCIKHTLEARVFFFFFLVFFYNQVHLYHAWIWSLLILLVTIMTLQGVVLQWKKTPNMFYVIILFFIISFLIVYFIRCKDNFLCWYSYQEFRVKSLSDN